MNSRQKTLLLVSLALPGLLGAIDATAVDIALPHIARSFQITTAQVSLVPIVYLVGLLLSLLPAGTFGDRTSHHRTMRLGLLLFGLSSLLALVAPTFWTMLITRGMQGIAMGILYTASTALIPQHWQKTELAFGVTGAFFALGMLIGPLAGGFLTDLGVHGLEGWRLIFAAYLPLTVLTWFFLQASGKTPSVQAVKQQVAPNRAGMALFKNQTFVAIAVLTTACMFTLMAISFVNTFYLQNVIRQTATQAGIMMFPIFLGMGIFSVVAGCFHNWRLGCIAACLLITAGLLVLNQVDPSISYFRGLFPAYLLVSAGAGFMITNTFAASLGSVPVKFSGLASGYINMVQQLGSIGGIGFVASHSVTTQYHALYGWLMVVMAVGLVAGVLVRNREQTLHRIL